MIKADSSQFGTSTIVGGRGGGRSLLRPGAGDASLVTAVSVPSVDPRPGHTGEEGHALLLQLALEVW